MNNFLIQLLKLAQEIENAKDEFIRNVIVNEMEILYKEELHTFLNWYVKDEAAREKPDRLRNIVDRYTNKF